MKQKITAAAILAGLVVGYALSDPEAPTPACARKLEKTNCMRMMMPPPSAPQIPAPVDPGEYNQFPAADAVGGCELVDCVTAYTGTKEDYEAYLQKRGK